MKTLKSRKQQLAASLKAKRDDEMLDIRRIRKQNNEDSKRVTEYLNAERYQAYKSMYADYYEEKRAAQEEVENARLQKFLDNITESPNVIFHAFPELLPKGLRKRKVKANSKFILASRNVQDVNDEICRVTRNTLDIPKSVLQLTSEQRCDILRNL